MISKYLQVGNRLDIETIGKTDEHGEITRKT